MLVKILRQHCLMFAFEKVRVMNMIEESRRGIGDKVKYWAYSILSERFMRIVIGSAMLAIVIYNLDGCMFYGGGWHGSGYCRY
jgi:hypothetical protein